MSLGKDYVQRLSQSLPCYQNGLNHSKIGIDFLHNINVPSHLSVIFTSMFVELTRKAVVLWKSTQISKMRPGWKSLSLLCQGRQAACAYTRTCNRVCTLTMIDWPVQHVQWHFHLQKSKIVQTASETIIFDVLHWFSEAWVWWEELDNFTLNMINQPGYSIISYISFSWFEKVNLHDLQVTASKWE